MGEPTRRIALQRLYLHSLDWLFPPRCASCGRLGAHWCPDCQGQVDVILGSICPHCGLPRSKAGLCADCRRRPSAFEAARSWARYNAALRPVVVSFKYRSNQGLSWLLAEKLAELLRQTGWQVDGVLPVPLAAARLRERGHNQAEVLARPLAMLAGLPLELQALERMRDTPKQVGLSVAERHANMEGAFAADAHRVQGGNWLLVDDVMTTGATLNAAAAALKAGGAGRVFALTLGRATL